MKYTFVLSKLALRDIDKIWLFTFENWSKTQANKYYKELFKEIEIICSNPEMGKSIDDIRIAHRIKSAKSHLIVYKIVEDKIYIDRVLHQNMNVEDQL